MTDEKPPPDPWIAVRIALCALMAVWIVVGYVLIHYLGAHTP